MSSPAQEAKHKKVLSLASGIIGLLSCLVVVLADITGIIVNDGYNPISETISDLAVGGQSYILDYGLYAFGIGVMACALGLLTWNLGGRRWKLSAGLLILLAIDIIVIAARNEYGDGNPGGTEIHVYLVYIFGILFTIITALLGYDFERISPFWKVFSFAIAVAWIILAPLFFFAPDNWDGAFEQFVGLVMSAGVVAISWLLLRRGLGDERLP
jgi:peptidoglycan/LPS O-acetylase OafA/YrhL